MHCAGYQLEMRRPGGGWEKASSFPIVGESAVLSDLIEGQEYEFRVAAITSAGVGDFSLNTAPVKVCERKRKSQWARLFFSKIHSQ